MGVFELGNPKEFSNKQLVLISEHLKLVEFRNQTFCNWLDGFLDANGLEGMKEDKLMKVLEITLSKTLFMELMQVFLIYNQGNLLMGKLY